MTRTVQADYETLASDAAGNWQRFDSFAWHARHDHDDADKWCIVYTSSRDSRLLDESNAAAIEKILAPYLEADDPDIIAERHNHWAVGYVDGYAIRVYDVNGTITPAFRAWCDIVASLEDYPLLDEEDYSRREYDATLANIESELRRVEYELPDDASSAIFSWLWDNEQREVESRDDQGGYPSREALERACESLGYVYTGDDAD